MYKFKKLFLITTLIFGSAFAGQGEELPTPQYEITITKVNSPAEAVEIFERACAEGNVMHCSNLGLSYDNGIWTNQDYEKAKFYFEKACNGDYAKACFHLGALYAEGRGVNKDIAKAQKLYEKACNGDNAKGCFNLAVAYGNGEGVKKDLAEAKKFFNKACNLGLDEACQIVKTHF